MASPDSSIPASPPMDSARDDRHFRTDHLTADLKRRSVRGGAVTLAAQGCKFALQMGSTVVLARLLTPADFGLVAMVAAFTGFVGLFKDLGLSTATVQRAEVNHAQASTLFWINVALSVALTGVGAGLAPAVAWFYGEPELTLVTVAISATFIFGGLSAQHTALLRRQMRFTALAVIRVLGMACGVTAAIVVAWYGFGYWALVALIAGEALAIAILSWCASGWWPGLPKRDAGIGSMVSFGAYLTGSSVLNYLSRNADNVILGKIWGAGTLGIYTKAYSLLLLPIRQINAPISAVAVPALSRLQGDSARYRNFYQKAMGLIAVVTMPLIAFCAVESDFIVLFILGDQWHEAVIVFRCLAPAAFLGTVNVATGWVYQSLGHTKRQFYWGIIVSIMTILAFVLGVPWGAVGVAIAFSISRLVLKPIGIWICFHGTMLKMADLLKAVWRPAAASAGASIAVVLLGLADPSSRTAVLPFLVSTLLFVTAYVMCCIALPGGRRYVKDISESFSLLVSRKARSR